MKFASLFSGIGGFDLGFDRAGFECVAQVELDSDCNRVLANRFPNVNRYRDVKEIGRLPTADVICGGFPCQDLSVAGKREGLAGERSGLWFEFLRVIESNLPRWIVIENVPGLLSSDESRDFAAILRGLVNVGYCLAWRVLDAQYYGVAQRRRRVFIVGSLGNGSCAEILFESESVSGNPPTRREAGARVAATVTQRIDSNSRGWSPVNEADNLISCAEIATALTSRDRKSTREDIAEPAFIIQPGYIHPRQMRGSESSNQVGIKPDAVVTDALTQEGPGAVMVSFAQNTRDEVRIQGDGQISGALAGQPGMKQQTYVAFQQDATDKFSENVTPTMRGKSNGGTRAFGVSGDFGVRRLTPTECERLQGFPDFWTAFDAEGKAISDSARYRMLGNAVAVPCAEWIAKRVVLILS